MFQALLGSSLLLISWPQLLFAAALAGHLILGLRVYNWCYGGIVSEALSKAVRAALSLIIAAAPVAYWWCFGFDGVAPLVGAAHSWTEAFVAGYLVLCWVSGLLIFPVIQLRRTLSRPPAALDAHNSRIVNVAAEMGSPALVGRHELWQARLPGNEIFQIDLAEKTLRLPRMPAAWDGLTILHLSDLHFCGTPDRAYFLRVVELCNEWQPDLIALSGDVVDSATHHRWVVPVLGRLRARLAAFAILGNHDYRHDVAKTRRRLRKAGLRVLANNWEELEVRGEPLIVVGHEGPWLMPPSDLSECPPEAFRLCLSHTPDNMPWARRQGIDLVLAGHVHGGQIRLPGIGSVFVPSVFGRKYDCGVFVEGPTLMHVSRGVAGEHPVRDNCRPEVTLLTLKPLAALQASEAASGSAVTGQR